MVKAWLVFATASPFFLSADTKSRVDGNSGADVFGFEDSDTWSSSGKAGSRRVEKRPKGDEAPSGIPWKDAVDALKVDRFLLET
mmetsp:Transcript_7646/g.9527  ORF Transcript_7646/g.9527 Transcript_7646/m.9527 type:complete len:84 (-) Transcript_7646:149-400(-)